MDQPTRQPKLLKDYAPPDYLVETVDLDFTLDPKATKVKSKLRLRPNPKAGTAGRPLVLDGEALVLQSLALDGKPLGLDDYCLDEKSLTILKVPARPLMLETITLCDPEANTALSGLYRSRGTYCTQCEPEGFRRITFFLDRPDVLAIYTVRIEADIFVCPRRRQSCAGAKPLHHRLRPRRGAQYLCRARQGRSLRLGHAVAEARHALGRGALRPRIRSRRVQHRRGQRLQHGGDGEQGPQHLQRQARAGAARHRERRRLRRHRRRHRPRIFS